MIEVRLIQREDCERVYELIAEQRMVFLKKKFMPSMGGGEPLAKILFDDEYSNATNGCVAIMDGEIVGYSLWMINWSTCHCLHDFELRNFFVTESKRRQGCGQAMLDFIKAQAKEQNMFSIEVMNMGYGGDSLSFWLKQGCAPNEIRLRFNVKVLDVDNGQ